MSALRVLGFCYLATASIFALAIAAADQVRLHEAMGAASLAVSDQFDCSVLRPVLAFARAGDEKFFDPPRRGGALLKSKAHERRWIGVPTGS
jgi:hypothetical protein